MRDRQHIRNNMRAVKASGSRIERALGKALWKAGLRYRKQYKKLPGKPDYVLLKQRIAIFCDSHFWHGYQWEERQSDLKQNRDFWVKKIERNIEHDKEINKELQALGWKVLRFWEHEIENDIESCVQKVMQFLDHHNMNT